MKKFTRTTDNCCFCNNPATKTSTIKMDYMGMEFPVVAVLCDRCYRLPNRNQLLRRYVDAVFGAGEKINKQAALRKFL